MISTHPAAAKLFALAEQKQINHFVLLEVILRDLAKDKGVELGALTQGIHIYPDLHGKAFRSR